MELWRKYIRIFILLILPVYLALLANSMMNMHVHVLSGGMVVRHAHPFDHSTGSGEKHHHSASECSFYHGFFLEYTDTSEAVSKLVASLYVAAIIGETHHEKYTSGAFSFYNLRGPPEA